MKKILVAVAIAAMLAVSLSIAALAAQSVTVTLDGKKIDCAAYGQEVAIVEGRTLVPLRAIFEALGASVNWNQDTKTVTSTLSGATVSLTIGQKTLYKNGNAVAIDVPAQIMNGRTMVPARAVAEAFGVGVSWEASSRTVVLTTGSSRIVCDGYGKIKFGMTSQEVLAVVNSKDTNYTKEEYLEYLAIRDYDGIYNDEDAKFTGNANCSSISVDFKNGKVDSIQVHATDLSAYQLAVISQNVSKILGSADRITDEGSYYTWISGTGYTAATYGFYYSEYSDTYSATIVLEAELSDPTEYTTRGIINGHYGYGDFYLGMPVDSVKQFVDSEEIEFDEEFDEIVFTDYDNIYSDEDVSLTGKHNTDYISLDYENGNVDSIYVSLDDGLTESEVKAVLQNMINRFGQYNDILTFEDDSNHAQYTWSRNKGQIDIVLSVMVYGDSGEYSISLGYYIREV